jgi:glycogen(starch) synthase
MESKSRPSVVLMTAEASGEVWTFSLELARALAEHEVKVALATVGAPLDALRRAEAADVPNLELFEGRTRLERMSDRSEAVTEDGRWLLDLRDRLQPDLVHLNGYTHAALPWELPTLVSAHSCLLSWWRAVRRGAVPLSLERDRREAQNGLLAADLVVAPTRAMLDSLRRHYAPLPNLRVIANGRDPSRFPPRAKATFVIGVGRLWDEAENLLALDRAAQDLEWPVYLAGERAHAEEGEVELLHARALGPLPPPALAEWLGRASICAHPARFEAFGLSVLEAALAGCALVLGDIPSLREMWDDAAVFVDPDDTPGLTQALRDLTADATQLSALAQRARARALELSPARMAQEYLEAYALAGMAHALVTKEFTA